MDQLEAHAAQPGARERPPVFAVHRLGLHELHAASPVALEEHARYMGMGFDAQIRAAALTALALGRLQRFARSGFKRSPTEHAEATLALMTV